MTKGRGVTCFLTEMRTGRCDNDRDKASYGTSTATAQQKGKLRGQFDRVMEAGSGVVDVVAAAS